MALRTQGAPGKGPEEHDFDVAGVLEERPDAERLQEIEATPMRLVSARLTLFQRLARIWESRNLLILLVRSELKVRYKGSFLGLLWSMINPALTLIVYYIVFQIVLKNGIPDFAIFLFAGLLIWNFVQLSIVTATGSLVAHGGIVKKVSFPREIVVLASVGTGVVFFGLQGIVMILAMAGLRYAPDPVFLPVALLSLLVLLIFVSAVAIFLAGVNVFLRDTQHLVEVALLVWFWGVPIVYSYHSVATRLSHHGLLWLFLADPIAVVVLTFQRFVYAHVHGINTVSHQRMTLLATYSVGWYAWMLGIMLIVSIVLFLVALSIFGRLEGNFAEEL